MNAPTLIVGLGGTGSSIVLRVSQKVTEEQRQQIGFAVFDTDVNELREIKKKNPFVHTIQTSTKLSVGEYLDIDTHARDTWFPVNAILNSKTLTEGAGQVRAVSRMAFETAIRAGKMEELHNAIEELYKLEGGEYQQALRVIIVSSLAGGTGSGLILPVALYIKNYLATKFRQSANISRGFFLLPEVFYGVIKGTAERNNLKSNAYATLRELDSFLMKGDATLPEKYKNTVKMEFPCVGSVGYEEYDVRPYDFCFLYDAKNCDGESLNSFNQYLDHAANCIYAQSIGPMNKRSNSSEDNTIRKLAAEKGRNRYAGAGTSMLIYPVEDVKQYLALTWAKEVVSDQWLVFDAMYNQRVRENMEMRRQGVRVADIREDRCYIDSVEQMSRNKDPFAMAIVNACTIFDETGFNRVTDKWDEYLGELRKKIESENSNGQVELDDAQNHVTSNIAAIEPGAGEEAWNAYVDAYNSLQIYRQMVQRHTEETSHTIAYTIFRAGGDNVTGDKLKYRLETYLRNSKGDFIHPNAVRYFLYKVSANLENELQMIRMNVMEEEEYFDNFEKINFDDNDTDAVETVYDLARTKHVSLMDRIRRRLSSDQEELKTAYTTYLTHLNEYRVNSVYAAVLEEGIEYVKKLSEAFQIFFHTFDSKIASIAREIDIIENKYNKTKGMTARYVCASNICLNELSQKHPYTGSLIDIDSDLAQTIYDRVRGYAVLNSRPDDVGYFSKIFDKDILDYFKNLLMTSYGTDIDMDVITAIEKEAEFEKRLYDKEEIRHYVIDVFNEAKVLAAPFIEKPLGEEKDPINSCTFNDGLHPHDDSPRATLIEEHLMNFGGEPDSDITKNMILFYKSFYGLRANDLSKFAPPSKTETYNRTSGDYFKAYYELVTNIHPITNKSKVLTPHIDRWWHNVAMMPDLDDGNQELQEYNIDAAFFWGLLGGYIDSFENENNSNENNYRLMIEELGMQDEYSAILTVSNQTPCDRLYEVQDALSIYPALVKSINEKIKLDIENEVNDNKEFEESFLARQLRTFEIKEFALPSGGPRSIFSMPFLLKESMTSDIYDEENVIRVLKVEIQEIENYITKFVSAKDYPGVTGSLIKDEFDLLLENIKEQYGAKANNVFKEYLFTRVYSNIAKAVESLDLRELATEIRETGKKLSKA